MCASIRRSLFARLATLVLLLAWPALAVAENDGTTLSKVAAETAEWMTDYSAARGIAIADEKMLLVHFYKSDAARARFENEVLSDPAVSDLLANYVLVKQPVAAAAVAAGNSHLLSDSSMRHMHGRQGLAVIDLKHKNSPYYHYVVSSLPFETARFSSVKSVRVLLGLPPGTLTQRTLVYAVRMHPDRPRSTSGQSHPVLFRAASSHSSHQARIRNQGHHQWNQRFQQISSRLGGGHAPIEVCAESWPGETLVEAAVECVDCWRMSSGHWSSVSRRHRIFGYDMRRGSNGIWYATGIFAN